MSLYDQQQSLLPDDRRIFHRPDLEYDTVAETGDAEFADGVMTVELKTESIAPLTLSAECIGEGTFRLRVWRGDVEFRESSPMIVGGAPRRKPAEFEETEEAFLLNAEGGSIRVGREEFALELLGPDGEVLWEVETDDMVALPLGYRQGRDAQHPFLSWRIHNREQLFGMGEKWNPVEKTGTRATIWTADTCGTNTCDLSYKAVPVLFSTRGWGMMLHSSYRNFWEIGNVSYAAGSFLTEDDKVDLFLFAASDLKELLRKYTELTGRPEVPPKWALGAWLSRCQYESRRQADEAARGMRDRSIPCDVVHLDPKWMKVHYYPRIGVDACDFDWNHEDFPEPEAMFRGFAERDLKVCLWINPYLPEGTDIYEEAKREGYLVRTLTGEPARNEHGQPVGMVDFTNPQAKEWWKDHLKGLLRKGASVFKPDYGERVPEDCVFHNGRTGAEMHNLYLFLYNQAVFEATVEQTGEPIIWGRSGYIGSQRYAGTWAGDTQVHWRAMKCCMRGGLSAGLTGFSWWSHDIGGFAGPRPSPELYIRWAQWGLLSPLARFHGTSPREPWEYGEQAVKVTREYVRLRYSLIPYLLAAGAQTAREGVPIMRHMALEFPDEPNVHTLDDQYMLGPDLLVAPIMVEGARSRRLYLPAGTWTSLYDPEQTWDGPGFVSMEAPLDRMPVLLREGAVIPRLTGDPQHLKSGPADRIRVDVYPGEGPRRVTFQDEGMEVELTAESSDGKVGVSIEPAPLRVEARFLRVRAEDVTCEQAEAEWELTEAGTLVNFDASGGAEVTLTA